MAVELDDVVVPFVLDTEGVAAGVGGAAPRRRQPGPAAGEPGFRHGGQPGVPLRHLVPGGGAAGEGAWAPAGPPRAESSVAATTTAAGLPATEAEALTARDAVTRGLVRVGTARWRAMERFVDMCVPFPVPAN